MKKAIIYMVVSLLAGALTSCSILPLAPTQKKARRIGQLAAFVVLLCAYPIQQNAAW